MLLRSVQSPARRIIGGLALAARAQISSAPLPRMQTAGRPANANDRNSHALPEPPTKKSLSYWSIAVAGVIMGSLAGGFERVYKLKRSLVAVVEAMPAGPPEMEPSQILNAMIDLKEDSNAAKDFVDLATRSDPYDPDPRSGDPKSVYFCLAIQMTLLHSALFPTHKYERFLQEVVFEAVPFLPFSWFPLSKAVIVAQDSIASELLLQAEAEIYAIRASACIDIFNLIQSDEVKTGRMKPIDVVKALVEPLQKARFNALSKIFDPVWERLAVVGKRRVARAQRAKEANEANERDHTVLG